MRARNGVDEVARFFDREACCSSRRPTTGRPRGSTGVLLELLDDVGTSGRTVLDVGSGQGELALALVARGAGTVTGVDLSPESIAVATRAAGRAGAHPRFRVANAAVDDLEPHDVVVLHRVVCCSPDVGALLANTLPAARSMVALSLPHSRGPRGLVARLLVGAENAWRRVRGDPFRAFVHDEAVVMRMLGRGGFTLTHRRDHVVWSIATFQRPGVTVIAPRAGAARGASRSGHDRVTDGRRS